MIECRGYISREAGQTESDRVAALTALYEPDRTFVVPILCNLALAGQVEWKRVASLPFEMALLPRCLYRAARMHVVSYALPALISLGTLIHERSPSKTTAIRWLRSAARARTLKLLEKLQPESGGFIEAIPLTSFVVMGLIGAGHTDNPVVSKGVKFLEGSRRSDGSWPIDSNLSIWVTTGAVSALSSGGSYIGPSPMATRQWLVERQFTKAHPYTGAARGGWAWTHLPGGVPDVDDTAGALLALGHLGGEVDRGVVAAGIKWLLSLQNSNGGWPTFCRGWGKLEFDRSAPDLTAHAMRAIGRWASAGKPRPVARALAGGFGYLDSSQRPDGSWTALWFGHQATEDLESPVIGTSRVLQCYRDLSAGTLAPAKRAIEFLVAARNSDEGWGGCGGPSTVEETALAVDALSSFGPGDEEVMKAVEGGARWLTWAVEENRLDNPSPVGLYFAKLWYAERLYPVMWAVSGLGRALGTMSGGRAGNGTLGGRQQ